MAQLDELHPIQGHISEMVVLISSIVIGLTHILEVDEFHGQEEKEEKQVG